MTAGFLDIFLAAGALFIGSFLTAAARAWPDWGQILFSRSSCTACGTRLRPYELIPVASYFLQRGRCRHCEAPIWWLHPFGELAALAIALMAIISFESWQTLAAALFGWILLFGALVDARTFLLPDLVTLGLIPAGLAIAAYNGGSGQFLLHLTAAVAGFVSLAFIGWAYKRIRGREGLGLGDAKLLAAGGAWTGLYALPWIVALGAGATLLILLLGHLLGRPVSTDTAVPLGPGLAAGCYLAYCLPNLVQIY